MDRDAQTLHSLITSLGEEEKEKFWKESEDASF
jgi:hypothetical protein